MFVLDSLLISGLRFVLDKIATVADQELNDEDALRERLLEAQLRFELGEIDEREFAAVEKDVLDRVREIKARQQGGAAMADDGEHKIAGVEISVRDDES
jgi:Gas vesicle protein G